GYPPRTSGVPSAEQDIGRVCGGFQRGACAPLCVVAGEGSIGEGPHRKGPSPMRFFGYFLSVQKVTRVWAGEAQEPPNRTVAIRKKNVSLPPARRQANPSASVPCAGTGASKKWGSGGEAPESNGL